MNVSYERQISALTDNVLSKCKEQRKALQTKREYEKNLEDKNLPVEGEEIIYHKIERNEPRIKYVPCDINCRGCHVAIPSDVLGIMKHMKR